MTNESSEKTGIKKAIAVMSGKGGVGKSTITGWIAVELNKRGFKVGILDGDITGPSIPKLFGVGAKKPYQSEEGLFPVETATGIKIMSLNLLIDSEDSPVIWRGPLLANTVKQFYTDVVWGDLDYLLVDLPPGTGDVPLTVMQSFPVDGMVIVSSPQDLVHMIVKKIG
ncbi:MAG: P-loop NTPase [Bacillota bacterium]|nr:P-loop NTPase [Bacillota bacterium]